MNTIWTKRNRNSTNACGSNRLSTRPLGSIHTFPTPPPFPYPPLFTGLFPDNSQRLPWVILRAVAPSPSSAVITGLRRIRAIRLRFPLNNPSTMPTHPSESRKNPFTFSTSALGFRTNSTICPREPLKWLVAGPPMVIVAIGGGYPIVGNTAVI